MPGLWSISNIAAHTKMGGQRWWHFAFFYTRDSGYSGYDGLLCIDLYPVSIVLSYLYYSLLPLSLVCLVLHSSSFTHTLSTLEYTFYTSFYKASLSSALSYPSLYSHILYLISYLYPLFPLLPLFSQFPLFSLFYSTVSPSRGR